MARPKTTPSQPRGKASPQEKAPPPASGSAPLRALPDVPPPMFPPRRALPAAEWLRVSELKPWERNPRRNQHAVARLAGAILAHGFGAPLVAQAGSLRLIAGHTRRLAVQLLLRDNPSWTAEGAPGPGLVPVRLLEVSDDDAKALALGDNNRALQGEWDDQALLALLGEARQSGTNALAAVGWDDSEIDVLLKAAGDAVLAAGAVGGPAAPLGPAKPSAGPTDPREAWAEMPGAPAFTQEDASAFKSVVVHFKTEADLEAFVALTGLEGARTNRYAWFPKIEIDHVAGEQWVGTPEGAGQGEGGA